MDYSDRLRAKDWIVRPVDISTARHLIENYHYAASATKTRVYTHGLFRKGEEFFDANVLGIAWWLPPTKNAAMKTYPEGDWRKVLSLTRLVISPNVPKNACSFMLSRSIKLIDASKWECLVTYADTWQGHEGTIYKATNWEYMGLTTASSVFTNTNGRMMGKKRGAKNLTSQEMTNAGFTEEGKFQKHKFRFLLSK